MPDKRLEWLRAELQRTADRMHSEAQRLHQIQEEIQDLEREISPPRRRLRSIQGGAGIAGVAAAAVEWIREHPTATVVTLLVSLSGILGLVSSNPWGGPQPHNPPIAIPAPGTTIEPGPTVARPAPGTTTPTPPALQSGMPRPAAPITAQPANVTHTPDQPTLRQSKPPSSTPPTTSPATPRPTRPPSTSPKTGCSGLVHVDLSPLANACVLDPM